jgi:endonuclease YncB( thermonuclease family)
MYVLPKWAETCAAVLAASLIFGMSMHDVSAASRTVARAPECPLNGTRVVSFTRALDGGAFATSDGEEVRLAGILAYGSGGEPLSESASAVARDALSKILRDRTVMIASGEVSRDRYGRTVAQVFADGTWVQAELLRVGQARAAPDRASTPCAKALLAAEAEGRERGLGQWRFGFRVHEPNSLSNRTGTFQIVEGNVVTASVTRGRAYINFGADYRTDFTVTIGPEEMRIFRQAKFDIASLAGKRIRVRGWVEFYNGPEITITTPTAIEVLN